MSAANIALLPDRACLIVDGAAYMADGTLTHANLQKAYALPTMKAAFTVSGPHGATNSLHEAINGRFECFEPAGISALLPDWYDDNCDEFRRCGFSSAQMFLIGWSDARDRSEAYSVLMCEELDRGRWERDGWVPFDLVELTAVVGHPPPSPEQMTEAALRIGCLGRHFVSDDPDRDLVHLLEVQRRIQVDFVGSPFHSVGGLALLSEASRAGVTQRVLHRWTEDRVGEKIQPASVDWQALLGSQSPAVAPAIAPSSMNRQQRRKWQAEHRA